MRCEQARQLFDAYLDGELSPSQRTEFGAHRLQCGECRRELALLEVAGHILSTSRESATTDDGFTDRLLACIDAPPARWTFKLRRAVYIGGPLAAAAVVALAFVGVFDRRETRVLGHKVVRVSDPMPAGASPVATPPAPASTYEGEPRPDLLDNLHANFTVLEQLNASTLSFLQRLQGPDQADATDPSFVGPPPPDEESDIEEF